MNIAMHAATLTPKCASIVANAAQHDMTFMANTQGSSCQVYDNTENLCRTKLYVDVHALCAKFPNLAVKVCCRGGACNVVVVVLM